MYGHTTTKKSEITAKDIRYAYSFDVPYIEAPEIIKQSKMNKKQSEQWLEDSTKKLESMSDNQFNKVFDEVNSIGTIELNDGWKYGQVPKDRAVERWLIGESIPIRVVYSDFHNRFVHLGLSYGYGEGQFMPSVYRDITKPNLELIKGK